MRKPLERPASIPLGPQKKNHPPRRITYAQWLMRGRQLYGRDMRRWQFRCKQCGHVQSIEESVKSLKKRGLPIPANLPGMINFSCEGRWLDGVGCDWTLGGLFGGSHTTVVMPDGTAHNTFEFAADPVHEKSYYLPHEEARKLTPLTTH